MSDVLTYGSMFSARTATAPVAKRLLWDQIGEKVYETGVSNGVLYLCKNYAYPEGVAWSGLTSVSESPSGAESNKQYADNIPYLDLVSAEEFSATIEFFTYPDEWYLCDGTAEISPGVYIGQQKRATFGFCFKSKKGNDVEGDTYGYKLHLIWNAKASTSEKSYGTTNESPDAITFSNEITTTPLPVKITDADGKVLNPVSSMVIDSTKIDADKLAELEDILYGRDPDPGDTSDPGQVARLPLPDEIYEILAAG